MTEPNIINATIDGLTNIEEAIKDKEEVTVIADDGYYFNKKTSTGWLTVLGEECYLKNGTIRLRDIDSSYTGTIIIEFKNNSNGQATKIEIRSPITLDTLVSGGYIKAVKIPEVKPEDKRELKNTEIICGYSTGWGSVISGYGVTTFEIVTDHGYNFTKSKKDGYLVDTDGNIHYLIDGNFTYNGAIINVNYIDDETIEISSDDYYLEDVIKGGSLVAYEEGETPPPDPEEPEEPEEPVYPTDYPKENIQNVYMDEFRIYKKSIGGGQVKTVKEIVKFNTIKEWLDGGIADSIHGTKGDIFIIAENGYNFSLTNEDGYIIDHKGNKLYFYEMYQQANNIPDEIFIDTRNQTYKNAKIYKGGTQTQPLEIIFYKYDKYELSMYLINFFEMETLNLGETYLPPFGKILKSKITEISINAPVEVPKYVTNLAYDTYIIDDEQLSKLRDNGDLYNDLMINTYNYPLKFGDNDLIETQFKIDSANFNADCKKFASISTEIPIFEFDIPNIKGVESVEIYPIYSSKILIDYTVIQGKHIKGVSVYDCITNTNVLKILADDVLIDYFDYNIQTDVPINFNVNKIQANGNISKRIPLFKSFIIMKTTEYMLLDPEKQNFYKGEITKLNSQILKKEFEMLENLFKTGIYINEEEKPNDK